MSENRTSCLAHCRLFSVKQNDYFNFATRAHQAENVLNGITVAWNMFLKSPLFVMKPHCMSKIMFVCCEI